MNIFTIVEIFQQFPDLIFLLFGFDNASALQSSLTNYFAFYISILNNIMPATGVL